MEPEKFVSKVIYNGNTLIDLTADTITADKLASGITAHDKAGAAITGTSTLDSDTSEDTATISEILETKTAHARGALLTGTMPNNGGVTGTISTVAGEYTIALGYHDGSGKVSIDSTEQSKIIATNIRQGITILGVEGTMTGTEDVNAETITCTPSATAQTLTPDSTQGYNYIAQVTVNAIPYTSADNAAGGLTVTIG